MKCAFNLINFLFFGFIIALSIFPLNISGDTGGSALTTENIEINQNNTEASESENAELVKSTNPLNASEDVEGSALSAENTETNQNNTETSKSDNTEITEPIHSFDLRTIIPDYNSNEIISKAVERHINFFTVRIRDKFIQWLERAGRYVDNMKEILIMKGLPKELVFLPLIESGFNTKAYSRMRAVGPWQFIQSTAKKYGLEINWWIDERRDPIKSTHAAADYLKDLYNMFNSWDLAMMAYNAGEGKVLRALKRLKTDDIEKLITRKNRYLKRETKEYVPKFIAASLIAYEPQKFGFDDLEFHKPLEFDEVEINSPMDLDVIAKAAAVDTKTIRELNPEIKRWCTPPDMEIYRIRIPKGKKDLFIENLNNIPPEERFTYESYKVSNKDTLHKIAKRWRIPVTVIYDLNPEIKDKKYLKPGTILKMPPRDKMIFDPDDFKKKKKRVYRKRSV